MRIHELIPAEDGVDLVIHNGETGHTLVLSPTGAVFTRIETELKYIAIAFGLLFTSDAWRAATEEEIEDLRLHPPTPMMELQWVIPPPKPRPKLTIVDNSPAKVVYEKDGLKIYDDDDTQ